ncbi:hypothetical protein H5410_016337 [Solanum commersonii]|uniref:Uncharacterized protein n=1 Tax=Solanum commersonii TaxID=4109 RepID=A0A9J5ZW61_SOLCO|nr:hypothetical protein H5410_016337 [Solanum commersonii]
MIVLSKSNNSLNVTMFLFSKEATPIGFSKEILGFANVKCNLILIIQRLLKISTKQLRLLPSTPRSLLYKEDFDFPSFDP